MIETLEIQLSEMEFFQNSDEAGPTNSDVSELEYAPLTNLGCVSEFAKLDVCIAASGDRQLFKRIRVKHCDHKSFAY